RGAQGLTRPARSQLDRRPSDNLRSKRLQATGWLPPSVQSAFADPGTSRRKARRERRHVRDSLRKKRFLARLGLSGRSPAAAIPTNARPLASIPALVGRPDSQNCREWPTESAPAQFP